MPVFEVRRHGPITEFLMGPTVFGRPAMPFRCYLVDGLLIDTGPPNQARDVARLLGEFPIRQVVNTHHHEDHAGNNALITALTGITPRAHALAVPLLAALPPIQLYRKLTWGVARDAVVEPLGDVLETEHHAFRVVHTPGHAPDHVVLVEPREGWLFSGDLYIHDRLKFLRREEDPHQLIDSLDRVALEEVGTIYCAHRGPVPDARAAIARKAANMRELREGVRALHARGLPAGEIMRRLIGREGFLSYLSAGDFTCLNMVKAYLPDWPGPAPLPPRRGPAG